MNAPSQVYGNLRYNMPSPQEKEPIYTKWWPSCGPDISGCEMFWKDCCTTPVDFYQPATVSLPVCLQITQRSWWCYFNLLHKTFVHLEKPGSFIRFLFVDFSSAFNTIQPHLLAEKLLCLNVDPKFTLWIVHFLLNRTHSVRFQSVLSSQLCTSTGAPQGTVLAPGLFTLYTNDCRGTCITLVIKYSDDSAIEDLSNSIWCCLF